MGTDLLILDLANDEGICKPSLFWRFMFCRFATGKVKKLEARVSVIPRGLYISIFQSYSTFINHLYAKLCLDDSGTTWFHDSSNIKWNNSMKTYFSPSPCLLRGEINHLLRSLRSRFTRSRHPQLSPCRFLRANIGIPLLGYELSPNNHL